VTVQDLNISAIVYCRGERCGRLHSVVVNDTKKRITDLIVDRDAPELKSRLVPVALAEGYDAQGGVHLSVSTEGLEACPIFNGGSNDN
jgi:hypothetical protein